jgi:vacuolar-type H+-ATPase subunit E/Vma4
MAQQVMDRWMPTTVDELRDALGEMMEQAMCEGCEGDHTVYLDVRDLALVKQTLTDGSVVFNVVVRENK